MKVNDGHSLYLETLSELGVVGLRAACSSRSARCWSAALMRLGGPERHAHGALVAGGAMLALHAGVDWDWEMPALFVWLFGAGGVVLAARARRGSASSAARRASSRALAVLVLAITPALFALSQPPLDRAVRRVRSGATAATAIDAALDATERFGTRPEPWQILGYCDARLGQYELARRAMDAARARDPDNWQLAYGQAIVYGVSGLDPRPYAARGAAAEPARRPCRARSCATCAARRRRPAGARSTRRAAIPFEY